MRRITRILAIALAGSSLSLGCHYHDYRDCLYEGDLSRDTHGETIYRLMGHEQPAKEPPLVEPSEAH